MSKLYSALLASVLALAVSYTAHLVWTSCIHASRARKLGCKPALVRQHRLPFGIDIVKRSAEAMDNHVLQSDDVAVYEELGYHATWRQTMLGTSIIVTVDPENIKAILATKFKDFELGHIRRGSYSPFIGDGIFTSDGKFWYDSYIWSVRALDYDKLICK